MLLNSSKLVFCGAKVRQKKVICKIFSIKIENINVFFALYDINQPDNCTFSFHVCFIGSLFRGMTDSHSANLQFFQSAVFVEVLTTGVCILPLMTMLCFLTSEMT